MITDDISAAMPDQAGVESSASPTAPALRMRRHRERRRRGLRCLTVELRDREIDALVRRGLLTAETRNVVLEINAAFYKFLDLTLGSTP
jgi:hypothetical protein